MHGTIFPLVYYYEVYLLPIFEVVLSYNSLMFSKLKFEGVKVALL